MHFLLESRNPAADIGIVRSSNPQLGAARHKRVNELSALCLESGVAFSDILSGGRSSRRVKTGTLTGPTAIGKERHPL